MKYNIKLQLKDTNKTTPEILDLIKSKLGEVGLKTSYLQISKDKVDGQNLVTSE